MNNVDIIPPKPHPPEPKPREADARAINEDGTPVKSLGQISRDTQTLMDRLKTAAVGEVVPYTELTALIKRDVQYSARSNMDTARRRLIEDEKMLFDCVMDTGLKRVDQAEVVDVGGRCVHQIGRIAKRSSKKLACISDYAALPKEQRQRHSALSTVCEMIRHATKPKQVKTLGDFGEHVPLKDALLLFGNRT